VVRWGSFAIYLLRDSTTPGSGSAAGSIMVLAVDRVTDVPARTAGKTGQSLGRHDVMLDAEDPGFIMPSSKRVLVSRVVEDAQSGLFW